MPSNHTQNYHLSQWVKTDKVLMEDFNKDNEKIDAAIKAVDVRVDGKADASALEAEISARTSAVSRLGNCRVERFTYYDSGQGTIALNFSGKPMVFFAYAPNVLVVCHGGNTGETTSGANVYYMTTMTTIGTCSFSWNGFRATTSGLDPNRRVTTYQIVAFYAEDGT